MKATCSLLMFLAAACLLSACTPLPPAAFPAVSADPTVASNTPDASPSPEMSSENTEAPDSSAGISAPDPAGSGSTAPEQLIEISVNGNVFLAELEGNAAAEAFVSFLPAEFEMQELNGNEKYCFFPDFRFPVDPTVPDGIHAGDLCIYQDNCLVLFYESFRTTYAYTPIGHITDPGGLAQALGSGDVTVRMALRTPQ